MPIYFITHSKDKYLEAKNVFPQLVHLDIELSEIQDIDPHHIIRHKLNEAVKKHKGAIIVDDTSLYLDCIAGLPGPLIKSFMQTIGPDGLYTLCEKFNNFKASVKIIIGYMHTAIDKEQFFEETMNGVIVKPKGTQGFGWDIIFKPKGNTHTYAQMSFEEKQIFNPRKAVFEKLKKSLSFIG